MVLIYTISLNLGIILCNFVSSHAYPRTPDEMPIPLSLPKFLNRNHSHMPLNISTPFQSLGTIFPKNNSLFHSNNSLVGKSIPCTSDEKICLRHNMVYVPSQEVCRPIGKYLGCIVTIDRNLARRINGVCNFENTSSENSDETKRIDTNKTSERVKDNVNDTESKNTTNQDLIHQNQNNGPICSGFVMINDSKCHSRDEIRDICGCDADPTAHLFGGFECNCADPSPIQVEQPQGEGFCRIPDFRYPDKYSPSSSSNISSLSLNCSKEQLNCFIQKKIWMTEFQNCFPPLQRGPCPEEHVVALNESKEEDGLVEGACVHERGGCPKGYKRLRFDQECYSDRELKIREMYVRLHPFGLHDVVSYWHPRIVEEEQRCGFHTTPLPPASQAAAANNVARPGWGVQNDRGEVDGSTVDSKGTKPSLLE